MAKWQPKRLSPKAKLALRALAHGAARTNKDAAALAQVTPQLVTMAKNSEAGQRFMAQQDEMLDRAASNLTAFLRAMSAEASVRMVQLMRNAESESIQFRAAQDLMDRNPEISKVQKHSVENLTIESRDAKLLASALVQSSLVKQSFAEAASGDFVKVSIEAPNVPGPGEASPDRVLDGDTGGV